MQLQAYKGHFENGLFYTAGQNMPIPEGKQVVLTILEEYTPGTIDVSLAGALKAAHQQALENGTSDMSLEEINAIIAECRQEKKKAV